MKKMFLGAILIFSGVLGVLTVFSLSVIEHVFSKYEGSDYGFNYFLNEYSFASLILVASVFGVISGLILSFTEAFDVSDKIKNNRL